MGEPEKAKCDFESVLVPGSRPWQCTAARHGEKSGKKPASCSRALARSATRRTRRRALADKPWALRTVRNSLRRLLQEDVGHVLIGIGMLRKQQLAKARALLKDQAKKSQSLMKDMMSVSPS